MQRCCPTVCVPVRCDGVGRRDAVQSECEDAPRPCTNARGCRSRWKIGALALLSRHAGTFGWVMWGRRDPRHWVSFPAAGGGKKKKKKLEIVFKCELNCAQHFLLPVEKRNHHHCCNGKPFPHLIKQIKSNQIKN